MAVQVKGQPIEAKPAAGLGTNAIIGYAIALAFALWPSLAARIPQDLQAQLPVVIGTVLGSVAAYYTRHTDRPDVNPVVPFTDSELEKLRYMAAQQQDRVVQG